MKKLIVFILLSLVIIPSQVMADGIIIEPWMDRWRPIDETSQLAAINYKDGIEKMIISVNFNMKDADEALWIFPVPSLPNNVAIDIVDQFPYLYGYDVVEKAKSDIDSVMESIRATQIYPMFFTSRGYYPIPLLDSVTRSFESSQAGADEEVVVHEHLEKYGITTEIITAKSGDALYDYLKGKGLDISEGSIPVLDSYIGNEYTFISSWVTPPEEEDKFYCTEAQRNATACIALYDPVCGSDGNTYSNDCVACRNEKVEWYVRGSCGASLPYYRNPGIFISFPTDKMYFPLLPTSAYGSKVIPITVYVIGHVEPEFPNPVEPYTRTKYYVQNSLYIEGLVNFFGDMSLKDVKYTKIEIEAPSKYFSDDLWMLEQTPAKISYANGLYSIISKNRDLFSIFLLLLISAVSGAVSGMLVFKDYKKFALVGLFNVFSIVGLAVALAFTKTRKVNEKLSRRIRKEGFMVISSDKRKLYFLILFSVVFLITSLILGYMIKIPLVA
jgi:hypothetical protein